MRDIFRPSALILAVLMSPWTVLANTDNTKTSPISENSDSDDLGNNLDHLEKKMTDQDNFDLLDKKDAPTTKRHTDSRKARDLAPQNSGDNPKSVTQQKTLKGIQSKISEYDNRVEILESELRRLRANIYDASVTDNLVVIEIRPSQTSNFLIRDLRANLDGYTLYNRQDPSGLWIPSKSITLFHGPLRPGDHQIDISAILVPLSADGLKLPTSEHKNLEQSFRFVVPEGKQRRQMVLEILNSADENPKPMARLIESETR